MLIGGHILLGAAIDDGDGLGTAALGKAGGIHCGVACANYGHTAANGDIAGLDALHPLDGTGNCALNIEATGLPCTNGEEDVGIAHGLQLSHRGCGGTAAYLHALLFHEGDVLLNGLLGNTERGDHVAGHAAEGGLTLEDGGLHAATGQEVGRSHTGGAAADDGGLLPCHLLGGLHGGHHRLEALLRSNQLGIADMDGLVIEVAGALILAAVGADGAGNEGQGVLLGNELQRRAVQALAHQLDVLGDVLCDGAAALTGGGEAVQPRHLLLALALGDGLDGLDVVIVGVGGGAELANGLGVRAAECLVGHLLHLLHHLIEAIVAAGLQNGGCHGDGPNTGIEELVAVEVLCAAGEGDAHLALELAGDAVAHLDGERIEGTARHIHLVVGQLAAGGIHGEGVGKFQTELEAAGVGQRLQTLEHRHGIGPLEILAEVMIVKDDVVVTHAVEGAACRLVAEDGGVALDEGVETLLRQQVRGNALDLIGRTAVEGGDGDGTANAGRDGINIVAFGGEQLLQHGLALGENGGLVGIHHAV